MSPRSLIWARDHDLVNSRAVVVLCRCRRRDNQSIWIAGRRFRGSYERTLRCWMVKPRGLLGRRRMACWRPRLVLRTPRRWCESRHRAGQRKAVDSRVKGLSAWRGLYRSGRWEISGELDSQRKVHRVSLGRRRNNLRHVAHSSPPLLGAVNLCQLGR